MKTSYFQERFSDSVTTPRATHEVWNRLWRGLAKLLRRKSGALTALFLSTPMFGQVGSQPMPVAPSPDSTIVRLADAHRKAVLDADVSGVLAVYRDDAVEMPPFQAPIVGRAAIEQFYRNMFKGPIKVTGFTFIHTETTVHDDVAYDVGTYKRTMSAPTGPLEAVGPYVVILKRTDGAWKLAYIIYNCDCPPPGPPPSAPLH